MSSNLNLRRALAVLLSVTLACGPALAYAEEAIGQSPDAQVDMQADVQAPEASDDAAAADENAPQASTDEQDAAVAATEETAGAQDEAAGATASEPAPDSDQAPADDASAAEQVDVQAADAPAADAQDPAPQPEEEPAEDEQATSDEQAEAAPAEGESSEPAKASGKLPTYLSKELVGEDALANGLYEIKTAVDARYVLKIAGSSKVDGALLQLAVGNNIVSQRWRITYNASSKTYSIINVNSGKLLETRDGHPMHKGDVQQDTANNHEAQQWRIFEGQDGKVYIISAMSLPDGKAAILTVPQGKVGNGLQVMTWNPTADGGLAQQWVLSSIERPLQDGVYQIASSLNKSYRLYVKGNATADLSDVRIYTTLNRPVQWWRVKYETATGYYRIVNCNAERALQVHGGKNTNGTNIEIGTVRSGIAAQRWSIIKNEQGGYSLVAATGGKVLMVAGNKASKNANVELRANASLRGQSWHFAKPSYPAIGAGTFKIEPMDNMKLSVVVVGAKKTDGANVGLINRTPVNYQMWHFGKANAQGWRQITAVHSGAYLSADTQGNVCVSNSAKLTSYHMWKIEATSRGYRLVNKAFPDKVLTVSGGKLKHGANADLEAAGAASTQNFAFINATPVIKVAAGTPIMGTSQVTRIQAVRYFKNSGKKLPAKWTKDGETIETIVKYFWEEGAAEGVRGDVAFAQSLLETGMFQFGNLVQPEQYNFAGLGATGPGHPGMTFKNARIGVRAQIQHLKAYASTKPLNKALVDTRYDLVDHGCAPTIKGLSGKWAVPGYSWEGGKKIYYHDTILAYLTAMLSV